MRVRKQKAIDIMEIIFWNVRILLLFYSATFWLEEYIIYKKT
tara:strand:- start:2691 stop:2816 length:126 start_codon:yes stop_codon:yes gene_type:complete